MQATAGQAGGASSARSSNWADFDVNEDPAPARQQSGVGSNLTQDWEEDDPETAARDPETGYFVPDGHPAAAAKFVAYRYSFRDQELNQDYP